MPTGYTAIIENKEDVTFKDYIMGCARAFGALIDMRDAPHDKKIPKEFKVSNYHSKELEKAQKRFIELNSLTIEEIEKETERAYDKKTRELKKYIKEYIGIEERYKRILKEVRSWKPPTSDHTGLKKLMIQQIEECTKFSMVDSYQEDLDELRKWSTTKWLHAELAEVQRDIKYHMKEGKEEVKKIAGRNKWLKDLRRSL